MSAPARQLIPFSQLEQLRMGRAIIRQEAEALTTLGHKLDASFCLAVDLLSQTAGTVFVCGMGKAGLIGRKITATLASTGTRAQFLHPSEAVHGDLGGLRDGDILLALSNSGETEELTGILPLVKRLGLQIVSITGTDQNSLAMQSDVVIEIGRLKEACPWGLAPTTTTTAMLAVGDALALVVSQARGFTPQNFATYHPGGSLGQKLKPVTQIMRPRDQLRVAQHHLTIREVLTCTARPGRRTGAVLLVDEADALTGLFTDSDLARLLESRTEGALDQPVANVMTQRPMTIPHTAVLGDVVDLLAQRKISELPVVDDQRRLLGLIDITDVIGWLPQDAAH